MAPVRGDDLVFPAGAAQLTNVNDLPSGTWLNTVLVQAGGYSVSGAPIVMARGARVLKARIRRSLAIAS